MYDEETDNDLGMSEEVIDKVASLREELRYREIIPEGPWYMGPSGDNLVYAYDVTDIDT